MLSPLILFLQSPKLHRNGQVLRKSPLAQRKKIKEEIIENNVQQLPIKEINLENRPETLADKLKISTRLVSSAKEPTTSKTSPERDGKAITHRIPEIVLSTIDKEMVVSSPLSKRKFNTVMNHKSSSFVES